MKKYTLDFETYYDNDYSLSKISTTKYIRSIEFQTHCVSVTDFDSEKSIALTHEEFVAWAKTIDWSETALCAHHAQFDGFILSHHYGIVPAFWYDTMSMSRVIYGADVKHSLHALAARLGYDAKLRAQALVDVKGVRDLSPEQLEALMIYCCDDGVVTTQCAKSLIAALPESELLIIDKTIRLYTEPEIYVNRGIVQACLDKEIIRKEELRSKVDNSINLMSNDDVVELLESLGVEVPMKLNAKGDKLIPALAKNDLEFKKLLSHENQEVRDIVAARIGVKSAMAESRAKKVLELTEDGMPMPIYYNHAKARTLRWTGGDEVNWQNLPRPPKPGSELRVALRAPRDCVFVVSDASQIEARINAWTAHQDDKVRAFADGVEVYKLAAALIYNKDIAHVTEDERFLGKTLELGCGYGAGAPKVNYMFNIGQFAPPINQTLDETRYFVMAWRAANSKIVENWRTCENAARQAFTSGRSIEMPRGVTFDKFKNSGFMFLPDGTYVRYDDVQIDYSASQRGDMHHAALMGKKVVRRKLYGGLIVENMVQALARCVLVYHINLICERAPYAKLVMTTHDEVVMRAPKVHSDELYDIVVDVMSTAPEWAKGLPLACKAKVSHFYDKS